MIARYRRSRALVGGIGFAFAIAVAPTPALASDKGWDTAGTIGADVLMAAALGIPAVQGDWKGDLQAGASIAVATGATFGLKRAFPEQRPDRSDNRSFPSNHTAVSFAAAASLENRYGWRVGVPAFAVATFVGVSRVEARKHHWYDVVAGGAIGTASGFLLTHKRDPSVRLVPWGDSHGGGVALGARF